MQNFGGQIRCTMWDVQVAYFEKTFYRTTKIYPFFCVHFESAQRSIVELGRHYFKLHVMAHW